MPMVLINLPYTLKIFKRQKMISSKGKKIANSYPITGIISIKSITF